MPARCCLACSSASMKRVAAARAETTRSRVSGSRITNRKLGIRRTPSCWALWFAHVSKQNLKYNGRRLQRKTTIVRRDLLVQKWASLQAEDKAMFKSLAAAEANKMRIQRHRLLKDLKKPAASHVSDDVLQHARSPQQADGQPTNDLGLWTKKVCFCRAAWTRSAASRMRCSRRRECGNGHGWIRHLKSNAH